KKYSATLACLPSGANTLGLSRIHQSFGYNVSQAIAAKLSAYILFNLDPELDLAEPCKTMAALQQAKAVIAFTGFKTESLLNTADILLPIALFAEDEGSLVNLEGRAQHFQAAVVCPENIKPAWKILRVLGDFAYQNIQEVSIEVENL